jgi:hypothetical protein
MNTKLQAENLKGRHSFGVLLSGERMILKWTL